MSDLKPRDVVTDDKGRAYAVTWVDGDKVGLRDVATKHEYRNVPAAELTPVPGLRERQ